MTSEQIRIVEALLAVLRVSTDADVLVELQAWCDSPDAINDVCDACALLLANTEPEDD